MKKLLLILFSITMILSLSACQKDTEEEEAAQLDSVSSSLSGTLTSYTGSEISIETDEGEQLTFDNCDSASLQLENGIVPGNDIVLVYVGALKDTDTSKVKIRKIICSDDNSGVLAQAKKEEENMTSISGSPASGTVSSSSGQDLPQSGAAVEKTSGTGTIVGGVNVRADAQSGSEILGTLGGGDSVRVTGICDNGWYRIVYEGQTGYVWQDYISYP